MASCRCHAGWYVPFKNSSPWFFVLAGKKTVQRQVHQTGKYLHRSQLPSGAEVAPWVEIPLRDLNYKPDNPLPISSHSWDTPTLCKTSWGTREMAVSCQKPVCIVTGRQKVSGAGVPRSWLVWPFLSCVPAQMTNFRISTSASEGPHSYLTVLFRWPIELMAVKVPQTPRRFPCDQES